MKKLIFLFLMLIGWMNGIGQNYLRLSDQSGFEISDDDLDSLDKAASELKNVLPDEFRSKFDTYDFGFYLHNNLMLGANSIDNIWTGLIDQLSSNSEKPYYLVFGRFYYQDGKSVIKVGMNLPSTGMSPCNTEVFRRTLSSYMEVLGNQKLDNKIEMFLVIKSIIVHCKDKVTKMIECCPTGNRNPPEECSLCIITQDEILSDLKNQGYFDLSDILDMCDNSPFSVQIADKNYTRINSNYEIKYVRNELVYNFTDAMEEYLDGLTDYDVNVKVYDDKPWTSAIGCYEDGDLIVGRGSRISTNNQTVIVLDYDQKPKVMVKLEMTRQPCAPLPVYIYDKTHDMNDKYKKYSKKQIYNFMDIAFNHSKNIYDKNGYPYLFAYTKLKTASELNALVMDDFNSLFYIRNKDVKGTLGIVYFEENAGRSLNMRKDCFGAVIENSPDGERHWIGSTIDLGQHNMGQVTNVGYTLAHELLHVLTIRGARIIGTPQKDFCIGEWLAVNGIDPNCAGGHLNDRPNLIRAGHLDGDPPLPSSTLHPREKIDHRAEYLMQHYLYKKVY